MSAWLVRFDDLLYPVVAETRGKAKMAFVREYLGAVWPDEFLALGAIRDRCKHGVVGVEHEPWYRCPELCVRFTFIHEEQTIGGMPDEFGQRLICRECGGTGDASEPEWEGAIEPGGCPQCLGSGDATGEIRLEPTIFKGFEVLRDDS
ncbi:MAG: hypothetical protein DCC49_01170 [Acidobacteria bacterium]|nr:MAG: hypothetical protein DCC49_01170 [Acidobacteriota bacterium]